MRMISRYVNVSMAAMLLATAAGCGSDSSTGTTPTAPIVPAGPKVATLTGNITANRTLTADSLYVLNGYVKVKSGATLTIQPGTKIVGDTNVAGSSLWITRGGKIDAQGTAAAPIVFTSQRSAGNRAPGDWGGIIIVGNALVNRSAGGAVATMFTEGPQGTDQNTGENYGGGTDANDNSGTIRYVRVEFAGYAVLPDQELNSLSMYAVGRGTKIEYVESLAGLDDSFEWFGGSVDTRYLVSYDAGDDHFDWTEGYNGRNQFLIALQSFQPTPRAGAGFASTDPHGFEGDGCEIDKAGCTSFLVAPLSMPVFANFTLVGPGAGATFNNIKDNNGAVIRRGSGGTFFNGVISRWQGIGFNVRDAATDSLRKIDSLTVNSVVVVDNVAGNMDAASSTCIATGSGGSCGTAANFAGLSVPATPLASLIPAVPASGAVPTIATLDWTPSAALSSGGITTLPARVQARAGTYFGGAMAATTYIGAADPAGTKWWAGWTSYARN
jgi:hypothetical protein